jgi:hypothetical protein
MYTSIHLAAAGHRSSHASLGKHMESGGLKEGVWVPILRLKWLPAVVRGWFLVVLADRKSEK